MVFSVVRKLVVILLVQVCLVLLFLSGKYYSGNNFLTVSKHYPLFLAKSNGLNCTDIIAGNVRALEFAKHWHPQKFTNKTILNMVQRCDFVSHSEFHFPKTALTKEEFDYPLAFVIVVPNYGNVEQTLRLLKAIYWPQNLYCITFDAKSDELIKKFVQQLPDCFPNVILPKEHIAIYWGHISILQSVLNCMKVLHQNPNKWRYVQILTATDFPLRTNWEMVQIFKILNGTNDCELKPGQRDRYRFHTEFIPEGQTPPSHWIQENIQDTFGGKFYFLRNRPKPVPEGNLTIYKGNIAASLTRKFIDFVLSNRIAQSLYQWTTDIYIADEQFWPTLIHNPHIRVPGASFPGQCMQKYPSNMFKPWISRYHIWPDGKYQRCHGDVLRGSCSFGIGDLAGMQGEPHLVAHKLYLDKHPAIFYCLNEQLENRTYLPSSYEEKLGKLNLEFYQNLPAVRYQRLSEYMKKTWPCQLLGKFWDR